MSQIKRYKIDPIMYWPIPIVNPKIAKIQIEAAVLKPNILSVVFIKAPAPRKPIPVIIALNNPLGFSKFRITDIKAKPQLPTATKINVANPIGLWLLCLSIPNKEDNMNTTANLIIIICKSTP